jgi:nitrilase
MTRFKAAIVQMASRPGFDVTGHCARPDVFSLTVDTRAKQAVREV